MLNSTNRCGSFFKLESRPSNKDTRLRF